MEIILKDPKHLVLNDLINNDTISLKRRTINNIGTDLNILKESKHLIYLSYDVEYTYLYLKKINNINFNIMINFNNISLVIFKFNKLLYEGNGTMFIGKIINDVFIISDLIYYKNEYMEKYNNIEIINILHKIFYEEYEHVEISKYKIEIEKFVDYCYLISFITKCYKTNYHINGILFRQYKKSNNDFYYNETFPVRSLTDDENKFYIKYKNINIYDNIENFNKCKIIISNNNIIMAKIEKTNIMDLYYIKLLNCIVGRLEIRTIKESLFIQELFDKKYFLYHQCKKIDDSEIIINKNNKWSLYIP